MVPTGYGTGFPSQSFICLSDFIEADLATRGCAISLVTLARSFFWEAIFAFLSLFLIPIQPFSYQTRSNAVQLNLQDVQTASQLPLLVFFPQHQFRDEPSSDALVTWRTTRTKRYINCRYLNPSPIVAWLDPF